MAGWAAHVVFMVDSGQEISEDLAEELCQQLPVFNVSLFGDRNRLGAAFSVEAESLFDATAHAQRTAYAVVGLLTTRGVRDVRPARLTVGTHGDMAVETFGLGEIPLVGYTDIAVMGGFSRQYARELAGRADFPLRVATVSGSPAFYRPEVEDYLEKLGKLRVPRAGLEWIFGRERSTTAPNVQG